MGLCVVQYSVALDTGRACLLLLLVSDGAPCFLFFFFQAEDGIRDLVRSRGLGDVYKRQAVGRDDDVIDDANVDQRQRLAQRGGEELVGPARLLSLIHI